MSKSVVVAVDEGITEYIRDLNDPNAESDMLDLVPWMQGYLRSFDDQRAAKDAALRQCVEAIEKLTPEVNCLHGQLAAALDLPLELPTGSAWMALLKADAAITAAKEALGDG